MSTAARKTAAKIVKPDRRALVVLGMHRSGTSAATRILSLSGASLPHGLMSPHPDNPAGFWESQRVTDLNDEILRNMGSNWEDVFAFRLHGNVGNVEHAYVDRAVELLTEEFNASELVVLKDPRVSLLAPFWERALREAGYRPHYVLMVRNPLEVAESLRVRDGFSPGMSMLLWSSYMIAAERDTRDRERTFVSYDQLLKDWQLVRRRIEEGSGLLFPRAVADTAKDVDGFLDRQLRHHRARPKDLLANAEVADDVKALYRIFANAAEGAIIDHVAVDAVEARLADAGTLVGPAVADLRGRAGRLADDVANLNLAHAGARGQADSLAEQLTEERTRREKDATEAARLVESREQQLADIGAQFTDATAECRRLLAKVKADSAREKARDAEFRALGKETKSLRALLVVAEADLAQFVRDLDVVETQFDQALRTSEMRADSRSAEHHAERKKLIAQAETERSRADKMEIELAVECQQTAILRASLVAAEGKLIEFERSLDEFEDEVEEAIGKIEQQAESSITAAEDRMRDEVRHREEIELLHANAVETGVAQVQKLTAELANAEALNAEKDAAVDTLTAGLADVKSEMARMRATMSWRLATPLRRTAAWLRARSA